MPIVRPCGVVLRGQELLVLRYRYGEHDRFNLPGGNLEADETLHDCLVREFREELNLVVVPGALLHVAETRTDRSTVHLVFRVEHVGEPSMNPEQVRASELVWLPVRDWAAAPLYPAIGAALSDWFARRSGPVHLGRIPQPWY